MANSIKVIPTSELNEMVVKSLRKLCAEYGLTKYSKATKPALLEMIANYYANSYDSMTVNELRKICTQMGYTGISKKTKAVLIDMILNKKEDVQQSSPIEESVEDDEILDISSAEDDDCETSPSSSTNGKITVICNARTRTVDLVEGESVWDIHQRMANEMGIPSHPLFTVNDNDVPNNIIIREGDVVEFYKANGTKGVRLINPNL